MTREAPERACLGNALLFESTHPDDHRIAKRFCLGVTAKGIPACPALAWCQRETQKALEHDSYGLGVEGTWAGVLYRDGRVSTSRRGGGRKAVVDVV